MLAYDRQTNDPRTFELNHKRGKQHVNIHLPEHMARITIKDMIIGEQAFTVPWSIQVDQDGKCWIRGDYSFTHQQFGTSKMSIKRTFSGFEVQVSQDAHYDPLYISPEAVSQMALLPVVRIN